VRRPVALLKPASVLYCGWHAGTHVLANKFGEQRVDPRVDAFYRAMETLAGSEPLRRSFGDGGIGRGDG